MKKILNLSYGSKAIETYDAYLPDQESFRTIISFHGGGIEAGDKSDAIYVDMAESLCAAGYGVFQVNYSLYPQTHFPEYIEQAAKAIHQISTTLKELGGNGEILIYGQSAGAYISLMLCLDPTYLGAYGLRSRDIAGWIIDSAQTTSHYNVIKYEKGLDSRLQRIDEFAPLYYINDSIAFHRMLMICYENDMPCRPEQNALFAQAVRQFLPDADLTLVRLPGNHCHGSCVKDEDGTFPVYKEILKWFKCNRKESPFTFD